MEGKPNPTPDAAERLWRSLELVSRDFEHDRLAMGRVCLDLRNLFSERSNSAAPRRSSGHGSFESELRKRGYKPNRIRECIRDYEVSIALRPPSESTAAKRKARRKSSADYDRGFDAGFSKGYESVDQDLTSFARTLSHAEAKTAWDAAAKRLLREYGPELLENVKCVWEQGERYYLEKDARDAKDAMLTSSLDNSIRATIQ
ncbi:MAG: hypothetical protein WA651_02455 [Candidatus Sulfotelmatobacter sp.]